MRERCRSILAAGSVFLLAGGVLARAADEGHDGRTGRGDRLLVWAGDQARQAPDFLAVVDFDERSPGYGKP